MLKKMVSKEETKLKRNDVRSEDNKDESKEEKIDELIDNVIDEVIHQSIEASMDEDIEDDFFRELVGLIGEEILIITEAAQLNLLGQTFRPIFVGPVVEVERGHL